MPSQRQILEAVKASCYYMVVKNLLTNSWFETWSGGNPTGWTVAGGAKAQETFRVLQGDYSLKLTLPPGTSLTLSQAIDSLIVAKKIYVGRLWVAGSSGATGAMTLKAKGTGWSATLINGVVLPAGFQQYDFTFTAPDTIPADAIVELSWDTGSGDLYVDSLTLGLRVWNDFNCFIVPVVVWFEGLPRHAIQITEEGVLFQNYKGSHKGLEKHSFVVAGFNTLKLDQYRRVEEGMVEEALGLLDITDAIHRHFHHVNLTGLTGQVSPIAGTSIGSAASNQAVEDVVWKEVNFEVFTERE